MKKQRITGTTVLLALAVFVFITCAPDQGRELWVAEKAEQADPAYGKGVGEYGVRLDIESNDVIDWTMYWMTGWYCNTSASLRYSEVQKDAQGRNKEIFHEGSSTFNWGSSGSLNMPFTRDFTHSNPTVHMSVTEHCYRDYEYSCERCEDVWDEYYQEYVEECWLDYCTDTESFYVYWDCEHRNLPIENGKSFTGECSNQRTGWGFYNTYPWAMFFRDVKVHSTVTLYNSRTEYDHNNCTSSNGKPFYLRISQGLKGRGGEDDFILNVTIDNKKLITQSSKSGLYSLAIAYCPETNKDKIEISIDGIEDDVWKDDYYTGSSITIGRGVTQGITLSRPKGKHVSEVLIESFDQDQN